MPTTLTRAHTAASTAVRFTLGAVGVHAAACTLLLFNSVQASLLGELDTPAELVSAFATHPAELLTLHYLSPPLASSNTPLWFVTVAVAYLVGVAVVAFLSRRL